MAVRMQALPSRYRDVVLIGRGGMGDIYRATDDVLGRTVAIKVLADRYSSDAAVRGRFTREALTAARLSGDPNSITIFDVGEHEGRPFIVMEHLAGGSLGDRLSKEGAQPPRRALEWLEQAARALDAAHARGIVHRDVKPGNLLLDPDDNVHVADFGVASAAGLDSLTATGTVIGTAGYLSPEQARGERASPASDVYALGVVAFELLAGERPYAGESATAEAAAHLHAPIPSVSERNRRLPRALDAVFERVLAKDPADRYASATEFVAALSDAFRHEPTATTRALPQTAAARPVPPPPRQRRTGLWALLVTLLLAAGAAGAIAAAVLTGGGDETSSASTFVKTVRQEGRKQTVTVTAEPTTATQPQQQPPPPPQPAEQSGEALNDQGYAKMQAGDFAGALPLLEQAVQKLQGTGSITEAYASYNLAYTRLQLGNCDGVVELLDHSESIQGRRKEIDRARKQARKQCE